LEHEYDAAGATNVCTVIVPDGRGSSATYLISCVDTGSAVTTSIGFGAVNGGTDGIDGAEANGTIEVLSLPATDGAIVEITNEMASFTLELLGPPSVGNIASTKMIQPYESARLKYIGTLAKWSIFA